MTTLSTDIIERVTSYMQHQATKSNEGIVEMVAHNHDRLLGVMDGHDDAFAAKQPAEGEWCLRELLRHIIDAEQLVNDIIVSLGKGQRPDPAGRGVGSMVPDTGQTYADLIAMLRETNAAILETIAAMPAGADLEAKAPHPFFGPLNLREWCIFQRVHDEDHIQHANKIIAALKA